MRRGAYVFGIYPRSDRLIELSKGDQRAFLSSAAEESKRLYGEQLKLGLSYASDPELTWDDMFRPISLSSRGIRVNGLNRFFETNTFYKVPVIEAKPELDKGSLAGYFSYRGLARSLITLPDPFTTLCLSRSSMGEREALEAIGGLLAGAAEAAGEAGYEAIALKGPSYAFCRADQLRGPIQEAFSKIRRAFRGMLFLHIYFGRPLRENLDVLRELDVDSLGFDPRALEGQRLDGRFRSISIGLIDGLNTKMEDPSRVAQESEAIASEWGFSEFYVTNNADLEYLPERYAAAKLKILGEVARA